MAQAFLFLMISSNLRLMTERLERNDQVVFYFDTSWKITFARWPRLIT
jgi:hypothetical protein